MINIVAITFKCLLLVDLHLATCSAYGGACKHSMPERQSSAAYVGGHRRFSLLTKLINWHPIFLLFYRWPLGIQVLYLKKLESQRQWEQVAEIISAPSLCIWRGSALEDATSNSIFASGQHCHQTSVRHLPAVNKPSGPCQPRGPCWFSNGGARPIGPELQASVLLPEPLGLRVA